MQRVDCYRILEEASEMGVEEVAFSGGEPFLWPPLFDATSFAARRGLRVTIYSSGFIFDPLRLMRNLVVSGAERCVISLFGASAETHECITKIPGSFARTIDSIRASLRVGLRTELHFVPFTSNFTDLKQLAITSSDLGVDCISVLRFVPQGRGRALKGMILNRSQMEELRDLIVNLRHADFNIRTGSPFNFLGINPKSECCSGIDRMTVGPDLRIYPCDAFKQIKAEVLVGTLDYSTLQGNSLSDCWNKSRFFQFVREYLTTPFAEPCASCVSLRTCLSGCLAQKAIRHGSLEKRPDPSCLLSKQLSD